MKRALLMALAILGLLGVAVFHDVRSRNSPPTTTGIESVNQYENQDLGISFTYPQRYAKAEGPLGEDGGYGIELVREEDAKVPENGEGPRTVSVRAYPHNGVALEAWLREARESNYSGAATSAVAVAGRTAIAYPWEGLYQGRTVAFAHRGRIVLVTVTYDSPEDGILAAYRQVLESLRLE